MSDPGTGFGLDNLPMGVFSVADSAPRIGTMIGDKIVDLGRVLDDPVFREPTLNGFLARGRRFWDETRDAITTLVWSGQAPLVSRQDADMHLPVAPGDFANFYCSLEHATNAGQILRPANPGVAANWRLMPVGYHGRAGTIVVSGTPVMRPSGLIRPTSGPPMYRPTRKLDVEVELGFIVGVPSPMSNCVPVEAFEDHVFGAVILLDWSARDIQALESVPLGPFLGKSFATSISPWIVPLHSLRAARVPPPPRNPPPSPHLRERESWSLDITLELSINGCPLSRPDYSGMYWSAAQQLAHLTSNGASLRTGDIYGSGTISSWSPQGQGSLLELSRDGADPIPTPGGTRPGYLQDGDFVAVSATARTAAGAVSLDEATGVIVPAAPRPGRPGSPRRTATRTSPER
ncbi:MAG TPA: fumarylacetoacetate hydrolase family protein [Streptosporangiaceae bacterium]|jgi:fumarylacetoacetase|nr:fumarylacetoacetate hydrolase family protein [Streptosporangiaceae bacterium]